MAEMVLEPVAADEGSIIDAVNVPVGVVVAVLLLVPAALICTLSFDPNPWPLTAIELLAFPAYGFKVMIGPQCATVIFTVSDVWLLCPVNIYVCLSGPNGTENEEAVKLPLSSVVTVASSFSLF